MSSEAQPGDIGRVHQIGYVSDFRCSPDRCIDSCCKRYRIIHVDPETVRRYEDEPALLRLVEQRGSDCLLLTTREGCPHLHDALCGLQLRGGIGWQPDACHFFPRKVIRLGDDLYVTSHLACNVIMEGALYGEDAFEQRLVTLPRVPAEAPDLLETSFAGRSAQEILDLHDRVLRWMAEDGPTSRAVMEDLLLLATLLDETPRPQWPDRLEDHLRLLGRSGVPRLLEEWRASEGDDLTLVYRFLQAVVSVSRPRTLPHFMGLMEMIRQFLQPGDYPEKKRRWRDSEAGTAVDRLLRRYLRAHLSETLFPINPWGRCVDEMTLVAARYCAVRLALMALLPEPAAALHADMLIPIATWIEIWLYGRKQPVFDHLSRDGWLTVPRMVSVLESC